MTSTNDAERNAWATLDAAIEACFAIPDPERPAGAVPVDACLIVGVQHVDDDGARIGYVELFPRAGGQPSYVTRGLIIEADRLLDRIEDQADDDDRP